MQTFLKSLSWATRSTPCYRFLYAGAGAYALCSMLAHTQLHTHSQAHLHKDTHKVKLS